MKHFPPLDGIRALAILAVLVFHAWPSALTGGFTGVDVFFVLSGFLITAIILPPLREGKFSFREFYLRRVQRLLPNLVLTVLVTVLAWTFLLPPGLAAQPARHGLWTLANLSNFYVWRELGGYWGESAAWAPLTHTWSLGVEEQFYLLFPISLWALARVQRKRMGVWLIVVTLLSLGFCVARSRLHPQPTFYLLPTRVWELLLGGLLASAQAARPMRVFSTKALAVAGWAGLAMIVLGYFVIDERQVFPGTIVLFPTLGTALLIWSVANGTPTLSRLLSACPLVGVGKMSYSLYLWHWPAIIFGQLQAEFWGATPVVGTVAGTGAGILLGWLAYAGVERTLRERGSFRSRRLAIIAIGFSTTAVACAWVVVRPPAIDPANRFDRLSFSGRNYDTGRLPDQSAPKAMRYADVDFPPIPLRADESWRTGGIIHLHGASQPQVVVLGSSHALMYSRLIDELCREQKLSVAFLGMDNGAPAFFESRSSAAFSSPQAADEFDAARKKWLHTWNPRLVFAIDRWDANGGAHFDARLKTFLREVSSNVRRVVVVGQVPVVGLGEKVNLRGFVTWRMRFTAESPPLRPDANEEIRRTAMLTAERAQMEYPQLRVLRVDRAFYRDDGSIRYASARKFFYADDDHLSDAGADEVRGMFARAITE